VANGLSDFFLFSFQFLYYSFFQSQKNEAKMLASVMAAAQLPPPATHSTEASSTSFKLVKPFLTVYLPAIISDERKCDLAKLEKACSEKSE